jgi:hypothetical protein
MKKRRLEKPKEKINRTSKKPAGDLCEQYAELLRLRIEIRRLAASGTKAGKSDRT